VTGAVKLIVVVPVVVPGAVVGALTGLIGRALPSFAPPCTQRAIASFSAGVRIRRDWSR
jgi:hypothetical protein